MDIVHTTPTLPMFRYAHIPKIDQFNKCARIMGVAVKWLVEVSYISSLPPPPLILLPPDQVISQQLEWLQCKSLTKATESQIHVFSRSLSLPLTH